MCPNCQDERVIKIEIIGWVVATGECEGAACCAAPKAEPISKCPFCGAELED